MIYPEKKRTGDNMGDDEWGVEINETRTNRDCVYVVSNPENTCDHPAHPHAGNNPVYCTKDLCPIEMGKIAKMRKARK